ncbi:hypothetical protein [Paenibacillus montanisoli]|uniref:Uncharacterized protein n=1 Tax=Paenibacillus montanisoli TaxID=2081970 RepID=A0A328U4Y8_9BACL|nr:hypothetical protein [Paenibacillus montanisoli]RAP77918.1 hypothetical protein DL346_05535 [Paenibacillus montanisoli]
MKLSITSIQERCLLKLRNGELTEQELAEAFTAGRNTRQKLLFLVAVGSAVSATIQSMSLYENGVISDGPADPAEWPYQTVSDAILDGWRVVQFPISFPLPQDGKLRYIPCEFVLEKIEEVVC